MTLGFKHKYELRPVSEILGEYEPLPYGRWQRKPAPTKRVEVLEIYKERLPSIWERLEKKHVPLEEYYADQQKKIGEIELSPGLEVSIESPVWTHMKGYVVWYSGSWKGRGYDVRREINVFYWSAPGDVVSESMVRSWLSHASKRIFGQNIDTVEGWIKAINAGGRCPKTCYLTTMASTGRVEMKEPSDYKTVEWEYLVDGKKQGGDSDIYRW